jgi:CheY-like chemotaxis protein
MIDDSPTVIHQVKTWLAKDGHVVEGLASFTELPTYMRTNAPELVVLDMDMPVVSGTSFAKFIRRCELTPTRTGAAYVGSALGREIVYERSRDQVQADIDRLNPAMRNTRWR